MLPQMEADGVRYPPGFPMPRDPLALTDRSRRPIVRRQYKPRFPFPVPNGWFVVAESSGLAPGDGVRKVIVAIDPGHGGEDPGALGAAGTHEKAVTLAVAREFAKIVDAQPGMQAVMVRDGDYFVALNDRYRKAREAKADLFVSIHADAFNNADARGSSVWVLSPRGATSEAARFLADRENNADLVGGVSLDNKDDTLAAVLLDLSQGATMEASNAVAQNVLRALAKLGPTHRGYVEKANFVVLRSPDVPSILVETAFISNPQEEQRLKDSAYQDRMAEAIFQGIRGYLAKNPPLARARLAQNP